MRHAIKWLLAFPFLVVVLIGSAYTITNTFSSGTTAVASQVNANFSAAKTAIDDNDSRITALEAVDTSAELRGVLTDETGTGAAVFAGGAIGAATATTASSGDNDTSVATTAFVQTELATKSAASSTDNAVVRFDGTAGDEQNSGVTISDTNDLTVPGDAAFGSSGAGTVVYRNVEDTAYYECGVSSGSWSCATDADGVPDGTL